MKNSIFQVLLFIIVILLGVSQEVDAIIQEKPLDLIKLKETILSQRPIELQIDATEWPKELQQAAAYFAKSPTTKSFVIFRQYLAYLRSFEGANQVRGASDPGPMTVSIRELKRTFPESVLIPPDLNFRSPFFFEWVWACALWKTTPQPASIEKYRTWYRFHRLLLYYLFPQNFPLRENYDESPMHQEIHITLEPWQDSYPNLKYLRSSWNTPQSVFGSSYIQSNLFVQLIKKSAIQDPFIKILRLFEELTVWNLRSYLELWFQYYPQDQENITQILLTLTRNLSIRPLDFKGPKIPHLTPQRQVNNPFKCMGPPLEIGIFSEDQRLVFQTSINSAHLDELKALAKVLVEHLPKKYQLEWIAKDRYLQWAERIFSERAVRCRQFVDVRQVIYFTEDWGQDQDIDGAARMSLHKLWLESHVLYRKQLGLPEDRPVNPKHQ